MKRLFLTLVLSALLPGAAASQSADELAEAAANPIANLISFPLQLNNDFGLGDFDRTRNVLNIQPVIPLAGGRVITRTILPLVWLPDATAESGTFSSGLSDIQLSAFYVPESSGLMWGAGPIVDIPTGGDERGAGKWSVGPSLVVLAQTEPWTLGLLVNNAWSIAGDDARADVNKGLAQYFIVRQLGDGWYVNSAPIITVDWKADSDGWIVPFGAGLGKGIHHADCREMIVIGAPGKGWCHLFERAPELLFGGLFYTGKTRPHFQVDIIRRAPADGIMRMVLQKQLPAIIDQTRRVGFAQHEMRICHRWFQMVCQYSLTVIVSLFEIHPS